MICHRTPRNLPTSKPKTSIWKTDKHRRQTPAIEFNQFQQPPPSSPHRRRLSAEDWMTKAAAEKKRVRRAGLHNGGKDDAAPKKHGKDVFQLFADKVRDHKKLESRWAVLQEARVEYFRGKDFVAFLKSHPELKEVLGSDEDLEAEDIGDILLKKNLLVRCDRVVKTVRPGKKKLSSWPAHLEIYHPDQVFSENDAFFVWNYVKRRPLWQTLLSFLWPVATLAICLFPVFPHSCKLFVLYACAGILLLILSLLLVRSIIFGAIWILVGKRVWFFPNILAEEATLSELFRFWPQKDEEERPKWTSRLFYAIVTVVVMLILRHHAPDDAARARYQKRVSNIIDDVLEWSPRLALSGIMEKQQPHIYDNKTNDTAEGSGAAENSSLPVEDFGIDEQVEESSIDRESESSSHI